jgi:signal transduction histidine kinase
MDNTTTGSVRVELWLEAIRDGNSTIEVTVQDSGTGMSDKRLGALFRDLEQVTSENRKMFEGTEIVMTT